MSANMMKGADQWSIATYVNAAAAVSCSWSDMVRPRTLAQQRLHPHSMLAHCCVQTACYVMAYGIPNCDYVDKIFLDKSCC